MDAKRISELREKVATPWVSIDPRWLTECLDEIERLQRGKVFEEGEREHDLRKPFDFGN